MQSYENGQFPKKEAACVILGSGTNVIELNGTCEDGGCCSADVTSTGFLAIITTYVS
jgi:hypothetical protein